MAYGSVKPGPGQIRVSTVNLVGLRSLGKSPSWRINRIRIKNEVEPYHFVSVAGKILYVNGRHQVYETDIANSINVIFNPVAYQMMGNFSWQPIEFTPLEKIEWVFL